MKNLKISRLVILIITVILEGLPFSAVLRFGSDSGEVIYETFSYFRLEPWGYGNPTLLVAVLTVALAVLVIVSLYKNVGGKFYTAETVISWFAFLFSLLSVVFSTNDPIKYVITGFSISVLLFANLIFCYLAIYNKKINTEKIIVILIIAFIFSLLILFLGFGAGDSDETVNTQVPQTTAPETATAALTNATDKENFRALKDGESAPYITESPHYRDLNFNNDDVIDVEDFKLSGMRCEEFANKLVENGNLGTIGEADYLFRGEISVPCGEVIIRY